MSLGGYKFAGRYCEKGSLTDAQWALRMHKTNDVGYTGLLELTPLKLSKLSAEYCRLSYAERQPTRKIYCKDCMTKMFTEDEIKVLKDEARERYRRELEEWHRERVRKGYGLCM